MIETEKRYIINTRLANLRFCIKAIHEGIEDFFKDYPDSGDEEQYEIIINEKDIAAEREKVEEFELDGYVDDINVEEAAILRKISGIMLTHGILLMHSSAIAVDGKAFLFSAPSGTGKTTHAALWRQILDEKAYMINDDKPFLQIKGDDIIVWGSPWSGKEGLHNNVNVPLAGIVCLHRGDENRTEEMERGEKWGFLINQVFRGSDEKELLLAMRLLDEILEKVFIFKAYCNMEEEAAKIVYNEAMKKI